VLILQLNKRPEPKDGCVPLIVEDSRTPPASHSRRRYV
jgi:hypothetical protein